MLTQLMFLFSVTNKSCLQLLNNIPDNNEKALLLIRHLVLKQELVEISTTDIRYINSNEILSNYFKQCKCGVHKNARTQTNRVIYYV